MKKLLQLFVILSTFTVSSLVAQEVKVNPAASSADNISISGIFRGVTEGIDTVTFYVWERISPTEYFPQAVYDNQVRQQELKDGKFEFSFKPTNDIVYISIAFDKKKGQPEFLFNHYLAQKGDSVEVVASFIESQNKNSISDSGKLIENSYLVFVGRGSGKYNVWKTIQKRAIDLSSEYSVYWEATQQNTDKYESKATRILDGHQYVMKEQLDWLALFKPVFSSEMFHTMRNELLAETNYSLYRSLFSLFKNLSRQNDIAEKEKVMMLCHKYLSIVEQPDILETVGADRSYRILESLLAKMQIESILLDTEVYTLIKQNYTGLLRERLATKYLSDRYSDIQTEVAQSYIRDALHFVKDENHRQSLLELQALDVGSFMYDFLLPDTHGKKVQLSDFRGKVVFIDFYYTGCFACATYFKRVVKPAKMHFKNNPNVVFMSVSIDGNRDKWIKSVESGIYTTPDAVNLYTDGKGSAHPVVQALKILGYPHPILIDRDGKIFNHQYSELGANDPLDLIARINEALEN